MLNKEKVYVIMDSPLMKIYFDENDDEWILCDDRILSHSDRNWMFISEKEAVNIILEYSPELLLE